MERKRAESEIEVTEHHSLPWQRRSVSHPWPPGIPPSHTWLASWCKACASQPQVYAGMLARASGRSRWGETPPYSPRTGDFRGALCVTSQKPQKNPPPITQSGQLLIHSSSNESPHAPLPLSCSRDHPSFRSSPWGLLLGEATQGTFQGWIS